MIVFGYKLAKVNAIVSGDGNYRSDHGDDTYRIELGDGN